MPDTTKRTNRTKILAGGIRARVIRPGETDEQVKAWQESVIRRSGCASMVFPSQGVFDKFLAISKAGDRHQKLVDRVMRQYFAGELVARPRAKASKEVSHA